MRTSSELRSGGYDDGYSACPCFWGDQPGSLISDLLAHLGDVAGLRILDAGAGEGKNAVYLAELGADVLAVDISPTAIANGRRHFGDPPGVQWLVADIRTLAMTDGAFDVVIAYGLLHCLGSLSAIRTLVNRLKCATKAGGYHVVCAFNDRNQDLVAHAGFAPILLAHDDYEMLYRDWIVHTITDQDLHETHPHNGIPHTHSMTRLVAQAPNAW